MEQYNLFITATEQDHNSRSDTESTSSTYLSISSTRSSSANDTERPSLMSQLRQANFDNNISYNHNRFISSPFKNNSSPDLDDPRPLPPMPMTEEEDIDPGTPITPTFENERSFIHKSPKTRRIYVADSESDDEVNMGISTPLTTPQKSNMSGLGIDSSSFYEISGDETQTSIRKTTIPLKFYDSSRMIIEGGYDSTIQLSRDETEDSFTESSFIGKRILSNERACMASSNIDNDNMMLSEFGSPIMEVKERRSLTPRSPHSSHELEDLEEDIFKSYVRKLQFESFIGEDFEKQIDERQDENVLFDYPIDIQIILDSRLKDVGFNIDKFDRVDYQHFWHLSDSEVMKLKEWNELQFKKENLVFELFTFFIKLRINVKRIGEFFGTKFKEEPSLKGNATSISSETFDYMFKYYGVLNKLLEKRLKPAFESSMFYTDDEYILNSINVWFEKLEKSYKSSSKVFVFLNQLYNNDVIKEWVQSIQEQDTYYGNRSLPYADELFQSYFLKVFTSLGPLLESLKSHYQKMNLHSLVSISDKLIETVKRVNKSGDGTSELDQKIKFGRKLICKDKTWLSLLDLPNDRREFNMEVEVKLKEYHGWENAVLALFDNFLLILKKKSGNNILQFPPIPVKYATCKDERVIDENTGGVIGTLLTINDSTTDVYYTCKGGRFLTFSKKLEEARTKFEENAQNKEFELCLLTSYSFDKPKFPTNTKFNGMSSESSLSNLDFSSENSVGSSSSDNALYNEKVLPSPSKKAVSNIKSKISLKLDKTKQSFSKSNSNLSSPVSPSVISKSPFTKKKSNEVHGFNISSFYSHKSQENDVSLKGLATTAAILKEGGNKLYIYGSEEGLFMGYESCYDSWKKVSNAKNIKNLEILDCSRVFLLSKGNLMSISARKLINAYETSCCCDNRMNQIDSDVSMFSIGFQRINDGPKISKSKYFFYYKEKDRTFNYAQLIGGSKENIKFTSVPTPFSVLSLNFVYPLGFILGTTQDNIPSFYLCTLQTLANQKLTRFDDFISRKLKHQLPIDAFSLPLSTDGFKNDFILVFEHNVLFVSFGKERSNGGSLVYSQSRDEVISTSFKIKDSFFDSRYRYLYLCGDKSLECYKISKNRRESSACVAYFTGSSMRMLRKKASGVIVGIKKETEFSITDEIYLLKAECRANSSKFA
ncbi:hypothetical protein B5S33_g1708 [[Candida] boidinii]|nr:hypothetical protein B5S33_g1708 [[Candida] boidinii]